jgi:hypothetical protein
MIRKNYRKFPGPPFRKEALKQGSLIITGPFNNFHHSGMNPPVHACFYWAHKITILTIMIVHVRFYGSEKRF